MSSLEPEKIVLIGASTGGPRHIQKILQALESGYRSAIVIAQHMDAPYVPSFVTQLGKKCVLPVHRVDDRAVLKPANVYVCASSCIMAAENGSVVLAPAPSQPLKGYNPNIDVLFHSSAAVAKRTKILGIILTGIGSDGAQGCLSLTDAGGSCIAESRESAVVYGMPMRARELNTKVRVEHLDAIVSAVKAFGA